MKSGKGKSKEALSPLMGGSHWSNEKQQLNEEYTVRIQKICGGDTLER